MSDEIRKDVGVPGEEPEKQEFPDREEVMPKDHEVYTPQGGGAGTGSGPIQEVAAVGDKLGPTRSGGSKAVTLPQVGPEKAVAAGLDVGQDGDSAAVAEGLPARPETSSFRLLMTLGIAGAISGALLVFVFLWSEPKILAYRAMVLQEAVTEVLKGPERFESIFLLDGELVAQVPEGVDTLNLDKVYLGYDQGGDPIGFALAAEGFGFQDIIALIFGYDAGTGQVLGLKVLRHLETPGLGDKIVKDMEFVGGFDGVATPIVGLKSSRFTGGPDQVETITGATISAVAVIKIINERIAELGDLLAAYEPSGGDTTEVSAGGEEEDE